MTTAAVEGPFLDENGQMFVTVDDETNERWLQEEIDSCTQAILDEEDDLTRQIAANHARVLNIREQRSEFAEQLRVFRATKERKP